MLIGFGGNPPWSQSPEQTQAWAKWDQQTAQWVALDQAFAQWAAMPGRTPVELQLRSAFQTAYTQRTMMAESMRAEHRAPTPLETGVDGASLQAWQAGYQGATKLAPPNQLGPSGQPSSSSLSGTTKLLLGCAVLAAGAVGFLWWRSRRLERYSPNEADELEQPSELDDGFDEAYAEAYDDDAEDAYEANPIPPEPKTRITIRKAERETFEQAKLRLLGALEAMGWRVVRLNTQTLRPMVTPHATSPDGRVRLWFKPQAIYLSHGPPHDLDHARSLLEDRRGIDAHELVRLAER